MSLSSGADIVANEMTSGTGGMQALAGVAAIILGILAVAGAHSALLVLVALLVVGAALIMTGSAMSWTLLGFIRAPSAEQRAVERHS